MDKKSLSSIVALVLVALCARPCIDAISTPAKRDLAASSRIVSLSPSATETLYALGLWPRVVGVTTFCTFPPEAAGLPKVGGFGNVNIEAVLRAGADLAVVPVDQKDVAELLRTAGVSAMWLDTRSLDGFMRSVEALGKEIGHHAAAKAVTDQFRAALEAARSRAEGRQKPRVLFGVMHSYEDAGSISDISIIGRDGFYNELISAAGGVNAYQGALAFPRLSREAVLHLNPDVIIDVIPVPDARQTERIRAEWNELSELKAVRDGRLHLLTDVADTVPGPRSFATLKKLSEAFFPQERP